MIQVGICDDVQILAETLCSDLKELFAEQGVAAEFSLFCSGKELLKKADNFDIVFLDLEMPEIDGKEVGCLLHTKKPDCKIVIVSGMDHRIKDGYYFQARRFVSKPIRQAELRDAVEAVLEKPLGSMLIRLYQDNLPYEKKQSEISYMEACEGHTMVYVGQKRFRRSENMSCILQELDPRLFVQISRSHIVNMRHIRPEADYKNVILNGKTLPISRRHRKDFREKYIQFDLHGRI